MELSLGGVALALALLSAILSAKWAMDLGLSQLRQVLWGIAGFLVGPLVLLVLYARLLRGTRGAARQWF